MLMRATTMAPVSLPFVQFFRSGSRLASAQRRLTTEVSDGDEPPLTLQLTLSRQAHPRSLHRLVRNSTLHHAKLSGQNLWTRRDRRRCHGACKLTTDSTDGHG